MRHPVALLLLIALVVPNAGNAQEEEDKRRYDVEIIVFENTNTSAGEQERWRPQVHVPEFHEVIQFDNGRNGDVTFLTNEDLAEDENGNGIDADANGNGDEEEKAKSPEGYTPLPDERLQLGDMVEKLEESNRYRVLRHLAWRQPADDRDQAVPIRVRAGEPIIVQVPIRDFEELYRLEENEEDIESGTGPEDDDAEALPADDDAPATEATGGGARTFATGPMFRTRFRTLTRPVAVHPLDGTVRVAVSRYLHVTTDLHLTAPVEWTSLPGQPSQAEDTADTNGEQADLDPAPTGEILQQQQPVGPDGQTLLSYPFEQSRRMRSSELHYLDHPILGLLIRVERAPQEEEADSEAVD